MLEVKCPETFGHQEYFVRILLKQKGEIVYHVPYQSRRLEYTQKWNRLFSYYTEQLGIIHFSVDLDAVLNLILLLANRCGTMIK